MNNFGRILMVEDDPKDVELTLTALDEYHLANEVVVAVTDRKLWTISTAGFNTAIAPKRTRQ